MIQYGKVNTIMTSKERSCCSRYFLLLCFSPLSIRDLRLLLRESKRFTVGAQTPPPQLNSEKMRKRLWENAGMQHQLVERINNGLVELDLKCYYMASDSYGADQWSLNQTIEKIDNKSHFWKSYRLIWKDRFWHASIQVTMSPDSNAMDTADTNQHVSNWDSNGSNPKTSSRKSWKEKLASLRTISVILLSSKTMTKWLTDEYDGFDDGNDPTVWYIFVLLTFLQRQKDKVHAKAKAKALRRHTVLQWYYYNTLQRKPWAQTHCSIQIDNSRIFFFLCWFHKGNLQCEIWA